MNKPVAPCVSMPVKDYLEPEIDLSKVDALLETWPQEAGDLPALLDAVMDMYGYLPLQAAKRIVQVRGVDLSDIFGIATMSPNLSLLLPSRVSGETINRTRIGTRQAWCVG